MEALRKRFSRPAPDSREREDQEAESPDPLQVLTAELLFFTGLGTLSEAFRSGRASRTDPYAPESGPRGALSRLRPIDWGPALLAGAGAAAHLARAFFPGERTRLATRTFDVAVVGVGLLSLADTLAGAKRGGRSPSPAPLTLASAALLGVVADRTESQHEAERERLEQRGRIVERLVPRRRPKLDRIVVHV